ncbi:PaaI family thioesterase [Rhodococcus chondri]|uniref:Acyl-coenzyme A thioesterase THEM4 n=1 Tax=Rhodococcus chondri TaxID=3065941 RepID=A0ABU7JSL8_9NOCA|nr:PaaI family thioesterase [Rhodococcus sp. CC-R104]MEE2033021.1 PaaI family thioesterase [Rhodococcus sp. CC-R104]
MSNTPVSNTPEPGSVESLGMPGVALVGGVSHSDRLIDSDAIRRRRTAAVALAEGLRDLIEDTVCTEVPAEAIDEAARMVAEVRASLAGTRRSRAEMPLVDDPENGLRLYNPAYGQGNPIAPPLVFTTTETGVRATCTVGLAYEGPPMFCHGGVSAMLLDQVLGQTVAAANHAGVTVDLTVKYRRPVPLQVPLVLTGRVLGEDPNSGSRRFFAEATLATESDPEVHLVVATGSFAMLRPDQLARMFEGIVRPSRVRPDLARD